jgi:hypothetical protein
LGWVEDGEEYCSWAIGWNEDRKRSMNIVQCHIQFVINTR